MLTVTTQDGATYWVAMHPSGLHGQVLSISRVGGADDPPLSNQPMEQDRWYEVHVLNPLPPTIGSQLSMVLAALQDDSGPVVRKTGMVTSVVGLLQTRTPDHPPTWTPSGPIAPASDPPVHEFPPVPDVAIPPRAATSAVSAGSSAGFFNSERRLTKTSGLFAAVMGLSALLGHPRQ